MIPSGLLGEIGKLREVERSQTLGRGSVARKISTRVKAFSPKNADALPPFTSATDVSPSLARGQTQQHQQQPPTASGSSHPMKVAVPMTNRESVFTHQGTATRVAHLTRRESTQSDDLAFIYDVADRPMPASTAAGGRRLNKISEDEGKGKEVAPIAADELAIVTSLQPEEQPPGSEETHGHQFPSLRPTTRKEVALLKHTMVALLQDLGCDLDQDYPTEMHAFLGIIQEEQKIYDAVFQEIIRQVTVNMIERGDVLAEIRRRYGNMFTKIPRHVRHLHTELVAQRKLNRRLSEELLRSKETTADLWGELEVVRKHDVEVTKQAQDAQEKLVSVLTQSDNTDEILEEYHKLYRMQRDRLEEAVRQIEMEKRVWIDAATSLALRIGQEHGMTDLVLLQKHENSRLRATNHMIVIISNMNDLELGSIERKIEEWRSRIIRLSESVVEEDQQNIETLTKMQRDMKMVLKNLGANEPMDAIEAEHPLLKMFHIYDVKSLAEHLMRWVEDITSVAIRFTSDKDLTFQEEILVIRKLAENWIELGLKLLRRNEKNTNCKDYMPLTEVLSKLGIEIEEWMTKLENRVSGEDGIASHVISLQNQLEDRYTTYSARDFDKPLPSSERIQLKESLNHWVDQIALLTSTLSNSSEKEQHKIPLHVENWIKRLLDQLNTDTDIRNEENLKLHTSMVSWMVHLLVKGGKEKPSESWDNEFLQLAQELISFNLNLLRDSSDIEMVSDDKKDLRGVVQSHSENWMTVAKRLLSIERKNAIKLHGDK